MQYLRRQQSYVAIAVAIYMALWGADKPVPIGNTLFYTLCLCNLTVLMQDHLGFVYERRSRGQTWLFYLAFLVVYALAAVACVNVIEYPLRRFPGQSLWNFLAAGWKFPFMATMIFGTASQAYRKTRELLEARNRELQRTVEVEVAQRELQGRELEQAREIQQSLLPKEIAQIPGFEIEGAWEPAKIVGGDYYDVIRLSDSKVGICIADVVGKSVSAALLMANVQATVRAFAADAVSPAALCSRVNSVLCSQIAPGKFVTLFYGVLDAQRRVLDYTSAGHLQPMLVSSEKSLRQLTCSGALLGVFPDWRYETSSVELEQGDRLLLFTDGITEAASADGEEFGEWRLLNLARECVSKTATETKERVLAAVKSFCASQLQDDATLIVISALPLAAQRQTLQRELVSYAG